MSQRKSKIELDFQSKRMDWRENVKEGGGKVRSVGVGFEEGSITNGRDDQRSA